MTLFRPYRLPAQNDEGVPLVGDDFGTADPGSNIGYGQNNDDSDEDYSAANLYGPPAAQSPPTPPSPNAGMTGAAATQSATPPPPVASDAPPPPVQPAQSPYSVKVQQAINNRADMQRPELPKPSIWRQIAGALAGTALGAIGGQRKEAQQQGEDLKNAIDYGPTALRQQAQYNQKVADADAQLGAIGKGEDILTRGDERMTNADTRKTNASIRDAQQKSSQQAAINSAMDRQITAAQKAAELGGVRVAADAPQTPNTTRVIDPMDFDPTTGQLRNKTALDVPVKLGPIPVNDPDIAKALGVPAGTMVDPKQYFDAVGKIIETTHRPPTEAAQKDAQIKADLASALGVPPETISDAQMNAGRRMFGGEQVTAAHIRDFIAKNKRLPNAAEESAIVDKDFKTAHPGPQGPQALVIGKDGVAQLVRPGTQVDPGARTVGGMNSESIAANKDAAATAKTAEQTQKEYAFAQSLASHPSPTNDYALLMSFIGATKPEGLAKLRLNQNEVDLAMGTRSKMGDLDALASHLVNGQTLTPEQRQDMLATMKMVADRNAGTATGATPVRPPGVPSDAHWDAATRTWNK